MLRTPPLLIGTLGVMQIRRFFIQHFVPSLQGFLVGYADRNKPIKDDISRGAELAGALLNFPDYILWEPTVPLELSAYPNARAYRENYAWQAEPQYELVCDFANSWKHRAVTRDARKFAGMENLRETFAICRYRDSDGEYYRTRKMALLELIDGKLVDLRRILINSSRFWCKELSRLQLVDALPEVNFLYSEHVSRADQAYLSPIVLYAVNKEADLGARAHCMDYDDSQQKLVSVRRGTGFDGSADVEIAVYQSPFSERPGPLELKRLQVTIRGKSTGPNAPEQGELL